MEFVVTFRYGLAVTCPSTVRLTTLIRSAFQEECAPKLQTGSSVSLDGTTDYADTLSISRRMCS